MNEHLKMSDVFVGSVALERMTSEKLKTLIDTKTACFALQDEYFWWCCNKNHAEASEIAINSYDQHIELITKQAEQINILREALQLVDDNDDKLKQSWFDCGYQKVIDAALSATEQKL